LITAVEQAMDALRQAIEALRTYDTAQRAAAAGCGFDDLLRVVPFLCTHGQPTRTANGMPIPPHTDGVLNTWAYAKLADVLPSTPRNVAYPPTFTDLQAADVAQTPLS
jgi:hypothetical protein